MDRRLLGLESDFAEILIAIDIDIFVNCNWVDTRWQ
jgi:hypothetical protein